MKNQYLEYLPKTLQEDLVNNRVIPLVGAGFSKNAILSDNSSMPDWDELGKRLASFIPNYEYKNAIDALSLFEDEISRIKLIETMAKELRIYKSDPNSAHKAFCDLGFDTICTTNFDFLIEKALNDKHIPYSTIVSEERLPIDIHEKTKLIKLHGDFNHPNKMIITENDYDTFIDNNKILTTYISNLFITKTLLLVGYSFDDNDLRTLWSIIGSRLGKLHNPAYVILVDASPVEVSRFERRNVKVININGQKSAYNKILTDLFNEIKELKVNKGPKNIIYTTEKALEEIKMPTSKFCFISAPLKRLSILKDLLYPILSENGITPLTLDEAIMPGESLYQKVNTLMNQSFMSIVDLSENNPHVNYQLGYLKTMGKPLILITDNQDADTFTSSMMIQQLVLNYSLFEDNTEFIKKLRERIRSIDGLQENNQEYNRLLKKGEHNAAVISVFRHLETTIEKKFDLNTFITLSRAIQLLKSNNQRNQDLIIKVKGYVGIRNKIVHMDFDIQRKDAIEIVRCVDELCVAICNGEVKILY